MKAWFLAVLVALPAAAQVAFERHEIEPDLASGYQLAVADLDQDGRPDVIGLSGRGDTLYWYENPTWERHAIVSGRHRMITVDAADLDGDGSPELALGTHFDQTDETSEGRVYLLRHQGDPREPWTATEVGRLPTTHRIRFVDLDQDGRPELVDAPLSGPGARKPLFEARTPLVYYDTESWEHHMITESLDGVTHGLDVVDWQGPAVLTASMGGVVRHRLGRDGEWERRFLVAGDPAERPQNGASEIRVGRAGGERFLATIEPWHGHQVVVYRHGGQGRWPRQVIDDSLSDGHALLTVDFDGDGTDEIVAGYRAEGAKLYIYRLEGDAWRRQAIDSGRMSAADCEAADLDLDGDPDLACIGARTNNIVWYENLR